MTSPAVLYLLLPKIGLPMWLRTRISFGSFVTCLVGELAG